MPLAVYILGLGIFAQGTSEFMLSGLLETMAKDLGVSIPDAGLLISAFAIGMVVGAPLLAVATLQWPRRTALIAFQAVFILGHVVGALAPGYWLVLVTRFVSAVAYAGFWAVAAVTALGLVAPNAKAKAMAVVAGGLSLATVVGLPLGTMIGNWAGWRAAFWAVAVLTALSTIAVYAVLPGGHATHEAPRSVRTELRALRRPRLWLAYATTALSFGALVATFSYLGTILTNTTDVGEAWVPLVLSWYGVGAVVGITVGGRVADEHPFGTLYASIGGIVGSSLLLALTAENLPITLVLIFILGVSGFAANPAVNARVFAIASDAPTLAGATNTASFNVGITIGPLLGGRVIAAGFDYAAVAWVGVVLGLAALATAWADSHARPTSAGAGAVADPRPAEATKEPAGLSV
ncbi:Cmx/CmrA family chloramphenicol efflux MFS transporter [Embleya sp. NBC_00896]|uniref:Cmx/CmrA family chloramphenicol efflux MFS transporter n=1 Tax=Embleya sp. NBC_00896 TaxID=2975961 RepID=UPI003870576A|nr:MFS transporter [Embleya sp. NBC_00896]